jgi:hypothetical protein
MHIQQQTKKKKHKSTHNHKHHKRIQLTVSARSDPVPKVPLTVDEANRSSTWNDKKKFFF